MRFLADMGVAGRVVDWLREQGHDAVHLREEGLSRLPDDEIVAKAISEHRIILTFDLDFGEIVALTREHQICVVTFRLKNTHTLHVIERLAKVLESSGTALGWGVIITVEESRHRIRQLPI